MGNLESELLLGERIPVLPADLVAFPRLGGVLCLEYANLLARRGREVAPGVTSYSLLVGWSAWVGSIGSGDARRLLARAEDQPNEARQVTDRAQELCHAIRGIVEACGAGRRSEPADVDLLNREWRRVRQHLRLVARGSRFAVELPPGGGSLERPLWPIVRSVVELLVSEKLDRVRTCAAKGCTYVFLDTTRNRSRRWCEMQLCGNRAKARRFQERHREGRI